MRRALPTALLASALLAGCGGDDGPNTFRDPHGTLKVKAGKEFRVVLRESPPTGYAWRFQKAPDPVVARVAGSSFKPEEGAENRAGAGGDRTLTFRAGRAGGRTEMVLVYVFTGGERGRRPADTRRLRVDVGDG